VAWRPGCWSGEVPDLTRGEPPQPNPAVGAEHVVEGRRDLLLSLSGRAMCDSSAQDLEQQVENQGYDEAVLDGVSVLVKDEPIQDTIVPTYLS